MIFIFTFISCLKKYISFLMCILVLSNRTTGAHFIYYSCTTCCELFSVQQKKKTPKMILWFNCYLHLSLSHHLRKIRVKYGCDLLVPHVPHSGFKYLFTIYLQFSSMYCYGPTITTTESRPQNQRCILISRNSQWTSKTYVDKQIMTFDFNKRWNFHAFYSISS